MEAENPSDVDYPFSGPMFVLTHEPPDPPDPEVTFLSGDIGGSGCHGTGRCWREEPRNPRC
jgi:hypothetical protein